MIPGAVTGGGRRRGGFRRDECNRTNLLNRSNRTNLLTRYNRTDLLTRPS